MSNFLETPLEALAFNYVRFGFFTLVNNLWTWVAVTAAVSFWRLRVRVAGSSSYPPPPPPPLKSDAHADLINDESTQRTPELSLSTSDLTVEPPSLSSYKASAAAAVSSVCDVKGRFTVYYEGDSYDESTDSELTVTAEEWYNDIFGVGGGGGELFGNGLEKVMTRVKMGDDMVMGLYRYLDLTVLNGNVVRLWDSNRRSPKFVRLWDSNPTKHECF